ncbi:MAG: synthase subunit epsilon [Proteobacteria bacterium]|nr:synthase subunit epsilon [Pseudomonadota bacterium]
MKAFSMLLCDASRTMRVEGVRSFVGEDASGSFGIMAGHARFMTCLAFGLARFRQDGGKWRYLAVPGAVLYFVDNCLHLSARRFFLEDDYGRIVSALQDKLLAEEESLRDLKESLKRLETEILKRIWAMEHEGITP